MAEAAAAVYENVLLVTLYITEHATKHINDMALHKILLLCHIKGNVCCAYRNSHAIK